MEEKKNTKTIDIVSIVKKLWQHKKTYYYVLPSTLIVTYLIILCVPRYYSCTVSLAPEPTSPNMSGSISSLASTMGLGSLAKMANQDAISSEIYPDVLGSTSFIADLMTTEVTTKDSSVCCNYYTYLRDHQESPWWSILINSFLDLFEANAPDNYNGKERLLTFKMSKQQVNLFETAKKAIKCNVNKKTGIVSITIKAQDPLVCATIASSACENLQKFIVDYRTHKAKVDYNYYKSLCKDSKAEYEEARKKYARYADANQDIFLMHYKSKLDDLENEMQQKYNIYTTINTQMHSAAAKLQEATPAFTTIQTATVPIKPAGPKRVLTAIALTILVFFGLSGWILIKQR